MPSRDWISESHRIYRIPSGKVYARLTIPGIGRKEVALGKKFTGDIDTIAPKELKALIAAKDRKAAEIVRAKEGKPKSLWRFEDLANEVVLSKKNKAFKTFESADLHLRVHLIPWMNERYPYLYEWDERGETIWQEYIDFKRAKSPNVRFLNHRKHLRMVLLRAFERRIIDRKITLYDPDPEIDVGQVLSHDQVKRLYIAAGPTLRTQILMAFTMGLRKSEILRLEWKRVDFENHELIFFKQNTKTRKPRIVPMNQYVEHDLLARWKKKDGPYVFFSRGNHSGFQNSNKTSWKNAKRTAKVTARFHDLRHTFITNAVRSGVNPVLICKYAGLSQEVMAKVYCHLDSSDLKQLAGTFGGKLGDTFQKC